jgi:hypothetical protein
LFVERVRYMMVRAAQMQRYMKASTRAMATGETIAGAVASDAGAKEEGRGNTGRWCEERQGKTGRLMKKAPNCDMYIDFEIGVREGGRRRRELNFNSMGTTQASAVPGPRWWNLGFDLVVLAVQRYTATACAPPPSPASHVQVTAQLTCTSDGRCTSTPALYIDSFAGSVFTCA